MRIAFWIILINLCEVVKLQNVFNCVKEIHLTGMRCQLDNIVISDTRKLILPSSDVVVRVSFGFSRMENLVTSELIAESLIQIDIINCTGIENFESVQLDKRFETVIVEDSDMEIVTESALESLLRLDVLKLNKNRIKFIHKDAFKHLEKAKRIELNFNQISWLHADTFVNCTNLKVLQLSSNSITEIPSKLFSRNKQLSELLLADNKILAIENKFPATLKLLKKLDLSANTCVNEVYSITQSAQFYRIAKGLSDCFKNFEELRNSNETTRKLLEQVESKANAFVDELNRKAREEAEVKSSEMKQIEEKIENFDDNFNQYKSNWANSHPRNGKAIDELNAKILEIEKKFEELKVASSTETAPANSQAVTSVEVQTNKSANCWMFSLLTSATSLLICLLIIYLAHRKTPKISSANGQCGCASLFVESKL